MRMFLRGTPKPHYQHVLDVIFMKHHKYADQIVMGKDGEMIAAIYFAPVPPAKL